MGTYVHTPVFTNSWLDKHTKPPHLPAWGLKKTKECEL